MYPDGLLKNGASHHSFEDDLRAGYEQISQNQARGTGARRWQPCAVDPMYQRAVARAGLAAIVLLPLARMPFNGFMLANGLDDVLLAAYSLLGAAWVLCPLVASAPAASNGPAPAISPWVRAMYAELDSVEETNI